MQNSKHTIYRNRLTTLLYIFTGLAMVSLFFLSCVKKGSDPVPVPIWVDETADSARLNILVQTPQGLILVNQYVNLALSRDSLGNSIRVRTERTSIAGVAIFRRLYPRMIYYNCFAVTNGQSFFGSGNARMLPGMTKDTILIVH